MNDYAIEDAALERERALVEGIHANATRLYDFVVALTTNAATPPSIYCAAWALVAACNTYQPEPVTVGDGLPF